MTTNKVSRTLVLLALAILASIQLAACGGGGGSGDTSSTPLPAAGTDTGTGSSATDTTNPTVAISQPTTAVSYVATTSTVTVAGSASDNVGLSQIAWTNSGGGSGSLAATGSSASFNFSVALANGSNVIRITATDSSGNTTQDQITVTYAPPSSGSVTLVWDPVVATNLSGYHIYYGTASGVYQQVASIGNSTTYTLNGLTAGTRYYFVVTAFNTSGVESGYSNEAYKDVF